ncbi:MAG: recombination factor protein RarA [Bdellovibrionaceae bacterium]|nr:recombination factor protein RarA [Pseudobdellovibrionaceae bacterium]|tara:strand:- start:245 stop:1570 length:1326 start_codon:yes stop_codon:yes gene_type:complete
MDLFEHGSKTGNSNTLPLAEKLRPRTLDEIIGQDFLYQGSPILVLFEQRKLPSLILWGPPGCGKTTFAKVLSESYGISFFSVNAISTGAKELRSIGEQAKQKHHEFNEKTLLFVDEIHRLNKSQQDVLLPFVEAGNFLLVGATTENPSFQINSALLSRCRVLKFNSIGEKAFQKLLDKAMTHYSLKADDILKEDAQKQLIALANGDARKFLNLCEQLIDYFLAMKAGKQSAISWPCGEEDLENILPSMDLYFDRGDAHYDLASAMIKSIRASDADAAIYYMARMLEGGEDPMFIARRLVISASEDVGNADPKAIGIATSCMQAVHLIGMPEAGITLAQATTYLASAPKSNRSYMAYNEAIAEVKKSGNLEVPLHIRNSRSKLMSDMGYGKGYQYAHNHEEGVTHHHLPKDLEGKEFYRPLDKHYEKHILAYLDFFRKKRDS